MTLARTREAFDHADFVFELKYDGFRALAYVDGGRCRLVSRKNHVYKSYAPLCEWIGKHLRADNAVLDGELACLDEEGRPQFNRLLRRRDEPVFVAFDLLWLNGRDLRDRTLVDRKATLRTLIRAGGRILYANHIDGHGTELYRAACRQDLEGIVAKYKWGGYCPDPSSSSWLKIKNPGYSQAVGRHEQFTRYRRLAV
jgi:bifunctional non-homologous end joining protein LigD